jgi:hypothetical protein
MRLKLGRYIAHSISIKNYDVLDSICIHSLKEMRMMEKQRTN